MRINVIYLLSVKNSVGSTSTSGSGTSSVTIELVYASKMSNAELNPRPVAVSPLIRFSRWTLLGLGVLYGAYHYNKLSKRENARREQELREKPMRDAKLAEERKRLMAEEAKMIDDLSRPAK